MGKTFQVRHERRKWAGDEDVQLQKAIIKHGTKNWSVIASEIKGRHPKQCRERWINHLDPQIRKGKISEKEWEIVLNTHNEQGNRWSEIAKLLPGRTPNQIKNYWHTMSRRKLKQCKEMEDKTPEDFEAEIVAAVIAEPIEIEFDLIPSSLGEKADLSTIDTPFTALIATAEHLYHFEKQTFDGPVAATVSQHLRSIPNFPQNLSFAAGLIRVPGAALLPTMPNCLATKSSSRLSPPAQIAYPQTEAIFAAAASTRPLSMEEFDSRMEHNVFKRYAYCFN